MTIGAFLALAAAGIFSGLVYELGKLLRTFLGGRIAVIVIIDFVVAIACGGLFVGAELLFCSFALSFYAYLSYFAGLILERATLGFLLAKYQQSVYNWFKSKKEKLAVTRLGKRLFK